MKSAAATEFPPASQLATTGNVVDISRPAPAVVSHPTRPRRHVWLLAMLAAGLLAAVGIAIDVSRRAPLRQPPLLVLAPVTQGLVVGAIRVGGTLEPLQSTVISQPVAGRVLRVAVQAGERVVKGQVLARFDPLALRADYARAEAQLVSAEVASLEAEIALYRRMRGLALPEDEGDGGFVVPRDVASEADIAAARAARAAAEVAAREAAFRVARQRLAQGVVRAPDDGVVLGHSVEDGQMVEAGAPLFLLSRDPSTLRLQASVPESDSARVEVGQRVEFSVPALPGRKFSGRVARILPFTGPATARTLPIVIAVSETDERLRPGMTATAIIRTTSDRAVVRVPSAALLFAPRHMAVDPDEPAVWLADGSVGQLKRVVVQIGVMDGSFVEVRGEGLREGAGVAVGYAATK